MNKYEAWRGHPSDVSSVFGQEGVASQPRSDIVMGQEDGQHSRTYQDGRTIHSPLTCLAKAVGGIDIRQNTGRERPPHVPNHPPIQHFPYPPPTISPCPSNSIPYPIPTHPDQLPPIPSISTPLPLSPPAILPLPTPRSNPTTEPRPTTATAPRSIHSTPTSQTGDQSTTGTQDQGQPPVCWGPKIVETVLARHLRSSQPLLGVLFIGQAPDQLGSGPFWIHDSRQDSVLLSVMVPSPPGTQCIALGCQ